MYTILVQGQDPKVRFFHLPCRSLLTPRSQPRSHYYENARRADRDLRDIFRTPADASTAPAAGLVGPLGASSYSLRTVERASAEMEGSRETLRRANIADASTREHAELDAAPSVPELL